MRSPKGPFRYGLDPVFLVSIATYFVNREFIKPNLHHYSPFFHGHLNDSLLVPVALPLFLMVYRLLGLRPDNAMPRWWEIGLHLIVWALFFEWFGPVVMHRSIGDPMDVLCYFIGGLVAWALWHLPSRSRDKMT